VTLFTVIYKPAPRWAWLIGLAAVGAFSFSGPASLRAGTLPDISGTWYSGGDRSKPCAIEQSGSSLRLRNEDGQTATGRFVNPSEISTSWPGSFGSRMTIVGRISGDLRTIRWSNATYWTRRGTGAAPAASPSPNPYREIRLASQRLENTPQGKIALLGGWAAVKRDGHGAIVCVSFKNEAAVAATRVVFAFTIVGRSGNELGKLELDRNGTFSPEIDINGWGSLSEWQGGVGHKGYGDNCKVLNANVAALPLLAAHAVTYEVTHVEYADGTSWTP
jgi:hypothetical protein